MAVPDTPLAGVFRVVYFLALAVVAMFAVLTGVMAFYEPPGEGALSGIDFGEIDIDGDGVPDDLNGLAPGLEDGAGEQQDYNRNVTLIYTAFAAGLFAVPLLGLGRRYNPLRAGLLAGGLLLFLVGMGYWSDSTDKWLGWLMTLVCAAVLLAGFQWLEDGLPASPARPVHRIEIPPASPPPPPPPPPLEPPPSQQSWGPPPGESQ